MGAYASIATWPGRGIRNQFGARLSRTVSEGAPMTLSIDDRRFNLMARGNRAWAPDRDTDAVIVGAMRAGRRMSIEGVHCGGLTFDDVYTLPGAGAGMDAVGPDSTGTRGRGE